jgi:hypothetical protein
MKNLCTSALFFSLSAFSATAPKPVAINMAADGVVNFIAAELRRHGTNRAAAEAAIDLEVDQYQGTGVTHLFWNVNYQRTAYDSQIWLSYWDWPDPADLTDWPRNYYILHTLGIDDVFARLIPRCRARGISPWISLRMNDHHYFNDPTRVPDLLKRADLRLNNGRGRFNYAMPEVRDHYLKIIAEVLTRYDLDGVDLDFIRTLPNFDDAEPDKGRAILTDFIRAARRLADNAAARLGHPVRLAARVPATPAIADEYGVDAAAWARDGLVDMLVPSDFWGGFADIPVEAWRERIGGPRAKTCLIYPCTYSSYLCTARNEKRSPVLGLQMKRNRAAMRGFAAACLDRGADGIYLFNNFDSVERIHHIKTPDGKNVPDGTTADLLRAAGAPPGDAALPRVHALACHDGIPPKTSYTPPLPAELTPGKPAAFTIHTGPRPPSGVCTVHVGFLDSAPSALAVRVNDKPCRAIGQLPVPAAIDWKAPTPWSIPPRHCVNEIAPFVFAFALPAADLARGPNTVELTNTGPATHTVVWLELAIDPAKK